MKTLYLHIGHAKTGSSYIQSCLAGSVQRLEEAGFTYPPHKNFAKTAEGANSSGNGKLLLDLVEAGPCDIEGNVLLSGEHIFHYFIYREFCDRFAKYLAKNSSAAEILLFIRDPVSHACSKYVQRVKNHGEAGSVTEHFKRYDDPGSENGPRFVNMVLQNLKRMSNVNFTVRNYSANKDVIGILEAWLGLDKSTLNLPPVDKVNRSLTRDELELQLLVNAELGTAYPALHRALTRELPELKTELVYPPLVDQEALWKRLSTHIAQVNAQIDASERYSIERDLHDSNASELEHFTFSHRQLIVLAKLIGRQIDQPSQKRSASDSAKIKTLQKQKDVLKDRIAKQRDRIVRQKEVIDRTKNSRISRWVNRLRRLTPRLSAR